MKAEGIFQNGDLWFGDSIEEDGKTFYGAYKQTTNPTDGPDYETEEIPERFPLFAAIIFPNGTSESFAAEYLLARRIGDARFGSQCQHSRSVKGYCPDCLRKVI